MRTQSSLLARTTLIIVVALCPTATFAVGQSAYGSGQAPGTVATAPTAQPEPPDPTLVRRLSLDDAVRLALEQNLTIQVERLNPQIQDLAVAQARTVWTPTLSSSLRTESQETPSSSFLSGSQGPKVSDDLFSTSAGVSQLLPTGGNYSITWDSARVSTTNLFSSFNPVLRSNFSAVFTQPLLRNFKIDGARQQLLISRKTREISDVTLRQTVVSTVRDVKNAYWNLAHVTSSLAVQQQSLDLARESLRNTKTRVEVGTLAPIDVVEAEAEVARNDETVIVAEAAIKQAEDRLRALVFDPSMREFWTVKIEPTDTPLLQMRDIDVDAAVRNALDKRTDILQAKKQLESADINIQYYRNQTLPEVNVEATYGLAGLGGTEFVRGPGFPGPVIGRQQRSFGSVLGDLFQNDFPTWTLGVTIGYPIGASSAATSLAQAKLQYTRSQTLIKSLELQAATQVRDLARQVNTNVKRVAATRASRELAGRRLEAEQKKFGVGMSTSFLVFQAQRDLGAARNNELRAILDYNQSLVDFEAVQEAVLSGGGITLASAPVSASPTSSSTSQSGATSSPASGASSTRQRRPF